MNPIQRVILKGISDNIRYGCRNTNIRNLKELGQLFDDKKIDTSIKRAMSVTHTKYNDLFMPEWYDHSYDWVTSPIKKYPQYIRHGIHQIATNQLNCERTSLLRQSIGLSDKYNSLNAINSFGRQNYKPINLPTKTDSSIEYLLHDDKIIWQKDGSIKFVASVEGNYVELFPGCPDMDTNVYVVCKYSIYHCTIPFVWLGNWMVA